MSIVILLHHLQPGGVTRIIETQVSALRRNSACDDIRVVTGDAAGHRELDGAPVLEVPELAYLPADSPPGSWPSAMDRRQ